QPVRGGVLGHDQRDVLGEALDHVQEELALAPKGSIGVEARLACELEREKADARKAGTERERERAERAHRGEVCKEAPEKAREERSRVRRELARAEGSCAVRGNGANPEAARIEERTVGEREPAVRGGLRVQQERVRKGGAQVVRRREREDHVRHEAAERIARQSGVRLRLLSRE